MDDEIRTQFVEANGLRFEVLACGNGGKLALLLHGFPEQAYSWRHQLPLLARLGYTAWAPNLRGYGRSSRPTRVQDYLMGRLLADVAGLIDAAQKESTLLIGHDWGGMLAWMFALQALRPLDRLVVMSMPHPLLFARGLRHWPQLRKSWYILAFQIPWLPEKLLAMRGGRPLGDLLRRAAVDKRRFPDELLRVYREAARQPGAITAMLNYYRANFGWFRGRRRVEENRSLAEKLSTPTLLLWAEEDVAFRNELVHGTEALVSDLTLRTLPGVGHFIQQEAPETVNTEIEQWLLRASSSKSGTAAGVPRPVS